MKLKLFSVLAGTTLGWILPPDNYTNPCEDFKGQFNFRPFRMSHSSLEFLVGSDLNYKRYQEHRFSKERQ